MGGMGSGKEFMASVCHYCPLCRYGRKNPDSFIGRMLHHPYHSERCPFWRAEKERYPEKREEPDRKSEAYTEVRRNDEE